jgi:hypothetical protein
MIIVFTKVMQFCQISSTLHVYDIHKCRNNHSSYYYNAD